MTRKQLGDFPSTERELVPETVRRVGAILAQWGGWTGAVAVYLFSVTQYSRMQDRPQWIGSTFLILLFIAIVGTLVRSRMRLTQTIIEAFKAGVEVQRIRDERKERGE